MWLEGVATLFVLTRFAGHSPAFAEKYWQIYEYIGSHPEAQKIDRKLYDKVVAFLAPIWGPRTIAYCPKSGKAASTRLSGATKGAWHVS